MPTIIPDSPDKGVLLDAFPSFEAILGASTLIQDSWVSWTDDDGREHLFLIGFLYRPDLPINRALGKVHGQYPLRAELVVLRGKYGNQVTGIRAGQGRDLARTAVRKYVNPLHLRGFTDNSARQASGQDVRRTSCLKR